MRVTAMRMGLTVALLAFGCSGDGDGGSDQPGPGGSAGDRSGASQSGATGGSVSGASGSSGQTQSGGNAGSGATGGEPAGGTSGASTGGTGGALECCGVDAPCPSGYSCQGNRDDLEGNVGTCEPTPTDGGCWNDIDCPADGLCTGGTTCACDVVCFAPPAPGTCEPMGEPCCHSNEDCEQGICVGADVFTKGRCAEAPSDGSCYTDDDCASGTCDGGAACPCGTNCPTILGTCISDSA